MRRPRLVPLVLLLVAAACSGRSGDSQPALVFAAASLAGAFGELAVEFERSHPGARVELHCAGTPQLVLQLREGAPVDAFASADERNMQRVLEAVGLHTEPRVFARNRLAIVTQPGNPEAIAALSDLAREDLDVVLCGPEVPAGRYARQALERAGVALRSRSDEPSVQAVLGKVQLGEVDAGIVYVTDAAAGRDRVEAVAIPDEHNVVASYPIVALGAGRNRAVGEAFVDFVLSPAGQRVLLEFGFSGP